MLTLAKTGPLARTHERHQADRLWAAADTVLLWPLRVWRARQLAHTFAELGERELADIGLTRHDVRDATGLPISEDPSAFLASRRRVARREQVGRRSSDTGWFPRA